MTLTIMLLWVVGIALLIGVAVVRGRHVSKATQQFASVDAATASAVAQAVAATTAKYNETADRAPKARAGVWVTSFRARDRTFDGVVVTKSLASSALSQEKPGKPLRPAKEKGV